MRFDNRVKFLNNIEFVNVCGKVPYNLNGQGINKTQFEYGNPVPENFFNILITSTRANNAHFLACFFNPVESRGFAQSLKFLCSFLNKGVALDCICGSHYVFLRIFPVFGNGNLHPVAKFNAALGMGNSCTHTEKDGCVILFGNAVCLLNKVLCFRRIRRFKHGHFCRNGVMS